jgi:peptidoglycan LD-endopeptidase LytH
LKLLLFIILILFSSQILLSDSLSVSEKWNNLDKKIASKSISKDAALNLIEKYVNESSSEYFRRGGRNIKFSDWVFPLKNFSNISYHKNGNDYNEKDYDYFDGNESWNHPANDICIADTNNDCLDDVTGYPVDVISMSGGIVIATDSTWEPGSILRAGKYIRIFDVTNINLFYYSHLKSVNKKPGDIIKPGDKIGEVGRTGRTMILSDGQTHLHIALLHISDSYPEPEPLINDLKRTEQKYKK